MAVLWIGLFMACAGETIIILWMLHHGRHHDPLKALWLERQLRMFREKRIRPRRATRGEKILFAFLSRFVDGWRDSAFAFTPRTLGRWKREWVAILMRRQRKREGRPRLPEEIRELIRRLARENRLWGPGRILRELAKLGLVVSRNTVRRYIRQVRGKSPRGDQRWSTFIRNHAEVTLAMDFAVDYFPTLTGKLCRVWILVLMEIGSRRIIGLRATEHPTREWIAQQLREAIPVEHSYRFLVHDNDVLWDETDHTILRLGIEPLHTPPDAPQANAFVERCIGTLRRELLDWIWPLGVRHLNRLLAKYAHYYNASRPHMGLDGRVPDPPDPPPLRSDDPGGIPRDLNVVATPHLGGLHHVRRRGSARLEDRNEPVRDWIPDERRLGRQSVASQDVRPVLDRPRPFRGLLQRRATHDPIVRIVVVDDATSEGRILLCDETSKLVVRVRPLTRTNASATLECEALGLFDGITVEKGPRCDLVCRRRVGGERDDHCYYAESLFNEIHVRAYSVRGTRA